MHTCLGSFGLAFCQIVVSRWREEVKRCKGAKRMSKSAQNKAPGRCSRRPGRPTLDRPSRQWASRKKGSTRSIIKLYLVDHPSLPDRSTLWPDRSSLCADLKNIAVREPLEWKIIYISTPTQPKCGEQEETPSSPVLNTFKHHLGLD